MHFKEAVPIYTWLADVLETEFEQIRVLKESPRGSVRLIAHRRTGERMILRRFHGDGEVYQRLLHYECRHLPTVLEAAAQGEQNLVLEEFVEGDTLHSLLQASLFSSQETRDIVLQLCQALWALHSIAAVHRDIKPENVILRGREAVLIDFDAARLYKPDHEADTMILGTVGFAAPEQYGLSQSDRRADIYSLGVLINVMLTGKHPSKELATGRLGRIVERCTQVNPNRRFQSVQQLMEVMV